MKKMMLVMAAGAMLTAAVSQADTVTSVNVVGYYSVTIPNNGLALVTPVLESFEPGTIGDLVGDQLPPGSDAFIWNRISDSYIADSRGRGGWTSTNLILRGDAVWLRPTPGSGEITVTFMGEVPGSYNEADTTTVFNIAGADAVGYSYPVDILWTNTALSVSATDLFVWDIDLQTYVAYSKGRGGWGAADTLEIKAGNAFWVNVSAPTDWEEVAPYDL